MDIAFLSIVLAVAMILMLAVGVWVSLTLVGWKADITDRKEKARQK